MADNPDELLKKRAGFYLRQLAPHQKFREGPQLIAALLELLERPQTVASQEYQEHHFHYEGDVGIAWNSNRIWICLDGVSLFRAKTVDGDLYLEFCPPNVQPA